MIKVKKEMLVCLALSVILLAFPLFGCAQNMADRKKDASYTIGSPAAVRHIEIARADLNDRNSVGSDDQGDLLQGNQSSEEKQEIMEKALELLENADRLWEKGNVDETLTMLDEAYSLILDSGEDCIVAQEKDDLRFLIARRILAVYSSKQAVVNGKNSEIPLVMNDYVAREIRSFQGGERNQFIAAYQRSGMYRPMIIRELKKAGIPEEFFWLPLVESMFKINAYSRARALGLWQFIPSTGYKFGLNRDEWIDERMDALKSTRAAIAYLKELHGMFGDWLTALAAYNCGEGRVLRTIARQNINYMDSFWDLYRQLPNETARYVPRFLATLHIVNDPQKYGFDLSYTEKPIPFNTVSVNKIMNLKDIAERIDVAEDVMNLLNSELRHKMTPDREYLLKVPDDVAESFNLVYHEIPQSEKPKVAAVRSKIVNHRVREGETLYSIARRYRVTASSIVSHNKLKSKNTIYKGQVLKIPTTQKEHTAGVKPTLTQQPMKVTSTGRYKVRPGDTLMSISRAFSVPLSQLKEINNIRSDKIFVGQNLKIPQSGGQQKAEASKTPVKTTQKATIDKNVLSPSDIDRLGTDKYIVTKNDTLHSIARKNNTNAATLAKLNNIPLDEKLIPGQILIVK